MEARRYWQDFNEVVVKNFTDGQGERILSLEGQAGENGDSGKIFYGGRVISVDVYLAVPTFIRRGITISV